MPGRHRYQNRNGSHRRRDIRATVHQGQAERAKTTPRPRRGGVAGIRAIQVNRDHARDGTNHHHPGRKIAPIEGASRQPVGKRHAADDVEKQRNHQQTYSHPPQVPEQALAETADDRCLKESTNHGERRCSCQQEKSTRLDPGQCTRMRNNINARM